MTFANSKNRTEEEREDEENEEEEDDTEITAAAIAAAAAETTTVKDQDALLVPILCDACGPHKDDDDNNSSSRSEEETPTSILEASLFGVACATMIYTFADLRLMSATGYACTPFENLRVASDACYGICRIPAAAPQNNLQTINKMKTSPANMLLSLLRELRREAAFFRDAQCNLTSDGSSSGSSRRMSRRGSLAESAPMVFLTNGTGGDHQDTVDRDRDRKPLSKRRENRLLDCIEYILKSSLKESPETRSKNDARTPHTKTGCCLEMNFGLQYSQLLLHNLYRDAIQAKLLTPEGLPPTPSPTTNGVKNSSSTGADSMMVADPETDGALYLLDQVIEQQQQQQLGDTDDTSSPLYRLLTQQFKPNSIAAGLLSGNNCTELVWFHDYFPSQEAVFAILVNHSRRAIQVVFRGTVTVENWISNLDFLGIEVPNPIPFDYPNKSATFKLHNGFQSYILRERKDTQQPWWKIICDLVDYYGQINFNGDYQLMTSGHSLGGACCTIFGFYASLDPRMTSCGGSSGSAPYTTKHKPVLIETFAAPMVGCHAFADAFRYQERNGKLRHARYYNRYDIVPKLPLNVKIWNERGSPWAHTGIGIELVGRHPPSSHDADANNNNIGSPAAAWSISGVWERLLDFSRRIYRPSPMRLFYQQQDDKPNIDDDDDDDIPECLVKIEYAFAKGYWEAVWEAIRNNICFHVDLVNCARNHSMTEYQERLQLAMAFDTKGCLSRQTMESLYAKYALEPEKRDRRARRQRRIESRQERSQRLQRRRGLALLLNVLSRALMERFS